MSSPAITVGMEVAHGAASPFTDFLFTVIRAIPSFGWLLLSASFFAVGEYLSKRWALAPSWQMTAAVIAVDVFATTLWLPALFHRNQLAIVGLMWLLLGTILTLSIGLFVFKEVLTWTQWAGMGFALVALVLLGK